MLLFTPLLLSLLLSVSSNLWVSSNQKVSVEPPLGITVDYKTRKSLNNLKLQLLVVEELNSLGNRVTSKRLVLENKIGYGNLPSQFIKSHREALTTKITRKIPFGYERPLFPMLKDVMFNYSTLDYTNSSTVLTETVSIFKMGGWFSIFKICEPDCTNSTYQSPVFGQSILTTFEIKNWAFNKDGHFLRLKFSLLFDDVKEFIVRRNNSLYVRDDQTPHCRTQLNRWSKNSGVGIFTTSNLSIPHGLYLSQSELNQKCYNATYKGPQSLGDDLRMVTLEKGTERIMIRCSDHVDTDTNRTSVSLQTAGLQGPIFKSGGFEIVLPKSNYLKYSIVVDMNKGSRMENSVMLLASLILTYLIF